MYVQAKLRVNKYMHAAYSILLQREGWSSYKKN